MVKSDFKEPVPCLVCGSTDTELHEMLYGMGIRDICIKHHIQCCLCPIHHAQAHKSPDWSMRLFIILGLHYTKLRKIIRNKTTDKWSDHDIKFLKEQGDIVKRYYGRWM